MSFVWRTLTDEEEERLLTAMALDGVAPPPRESPSPRTFFENALKTVASASQVPTVPNQTSEIPNFQQMLDQLGYGTPTNHGNLLNFNDMTVPQAQTAPAAQSLPSEPVLNFGLPQVPISAGIWPTNMNSLIPTLFIDTSFIIKNLHSNTKHHETGSKISIYTIDKKILKYHIHFCFPLLFHLKMKTLILLILLLCLSYATHHRSLKCYYYDELTKEKSIEHGRTECYARYDFSAKNGYFGGTRRHNVDIKYRNSTEHCEDMMDIHLNGTARPVYICYCFKDYCNFPFTFNEFVARGRTLQPFYDD
ncbi:hypothetical protein B9Z55_026448 [Caenorhabditis nigoni]|uniref:Uncharacterized protein n=1 Tax=Caenorhabditis nigoni TaxID=1611254 RepID=A0A2G5T3Q7_9PELO|nr:hypothetical protein B9Z55_026448 [Caenorhabditis nigoni]